MPHDHIREIFRILLREALGTGISYDCPEARTTEDIVSEEVVYLAGRLKAKRVLDLACGNSDMACMIRHLTGDDVEVVAADNDPRVIDAARDACNCSVRYEVFDILKPAYIGKYGAIHCGGLLHHVEDLPTVMGNIYHLLEDPGFAYFTDILKRDVPESELSGCEKTAHTEEAVLESMDQAGFIHRELMILENDDIKGFKIPVFKDTGDRIHIQRGSNGAYKIFVRGDSGLFIP